MSDLNPYPDPQPENWRTILGTLVKIAGAGLAVLLGAGIFLLTQTPFWALLGKSLNQLFAIDSVQLMWYITRSAGFIAYLLLWLSTAWGLAVSSKILDAILHRSFTYDFHQFISLLAIGFILLHIIVLMADRYLPYNLAQVLVPFLSPYRPLWVGIGVLGFYLTLLVTITFYLRNRIGMKAFRAIHILSLLGYLGATVHGFFSGTDSSLWTVQLLYASTFFSTVFLTAYWLVMRPYLRPKPVKKAPLPPGHVHRHSSHPASSSWMTTQRRT
jgi:predicted ferric reductase